LNSVIGGGSNWSLPAIWAPLLRYFSGPILAIILSLAYPTFEGLNNDPLHVMGFIIGHCLLLWCILGFVMPRWLDVFIIPERRDDWKQPIAPCVVRSTREAEISSSMEEAASGSGSMVHDAKLESSSVTKDPRSDRLANGDLNDNNSDPLFPDAPMRKY
jgi:solute carrier family 6 GABA transporter-like protein 1